MPNPTGTLSDTRYWEHNIGDVAADSPIVLALHWMSGDANSMRGIFEGLTVPVRALFLQARYPSGDTVNGGYSWFPDEERFYSRSFTDQAQSIKAEGDRIAAFLRLYRQTHPSRAVVVLGMSQGGDLTLSLATTHPDLVTLGLACAGRVLPTVPEYPADVRLPRIVMMQGEKDVPVPVEVARSDAARLRKARFDTTYVEYADVEHTITPEMITLMRQEITRI
jgi:predicted esterase